MSFYAQMFTDFADAKEFAKKVKEKDVENVVDGIEINLNVDDKELVDYYIEVSKHLKENNLELFLHAPNFNKLSSIEKLISVYKKFEDAYGDKIRFNIHPVFSDHFTYYDKKDTLDEIEVLDEVMEHSHLHMEYCVENLNERYNLKRINVDKIDEILEKSNIKFCWDIGHAVFDGIKSYELTKIQKERLMHVHLHDVCCKIDHLPFIGADVDYEKALKYLININYNNSITIELAHENLKGKTTEDKVVNYIKEIKKIKDTYSEYKQLVSVGV